MGNAKIFIVEDETIIAMALEDSLIYSGYQVCGKATSGEVALEKIAATQPDLILMDIRLAGEMTGIEAAHQVRSQFQIPIIFLTALNDSDTLEKAKLTEPFGYLIKPCEDRDLITSIEIGLARHRAETAIRAALEKEKELQELKSRFISIVSHEFRTPLTQISLSNSILQDYPHLPQHKKNIHSQRISRAVEQINQLLKEIWSFNIAESKGLQCRPAPCHLGLICQDLVEQMQSTTNEIPIILTLEKQEQFSNWVYLDEKLLRHILNNLLSNAIKYSPPAQPVMLHVSFEPRKIIFVVKDTGIGIPEADQQWLFGSFYRASNTAGIPGMGLGLSIVRECVELQGGDLTLESREGQGTTITVSLPLLPALSPTPVDFRPSKNIKN